MTARKVQKKSFRDKTKKVKHPVFEDFASLDTEARIQKCVEILPEVLGEWELSHPEWRIEALLWILDASLKSLRQYIERSEEPEISWESPFVELHFPIQCSWNEVAEDRPSFELVTGYITNDGVKDIESIRSHLSKLLVEHIQLVALQELTNYTGFEKRDGEFQTILDPSTIEFLKEHFPPEDHEREINRLFWPLSFGAGHVDYGDDNSDGLENESEITKDAYEQIEAIRPPLLSIPFDADGRKLRVITILEINPLIADRDKKEAYFPIVVGLAIQLDSDPTGEESPLEIIEAAAFPEWPEEQRVILWEALDQLIRRMLDLSDPEPKPEMIEAVLTVSAQIRFMVPKGDKKFLDKAMARLTGTLGKGGEILSVDMRHSGRLLTDQAGLGHIKDLLRKVEESHTSEEKGKSLEALTAELFVSIPSFSVLNRVRTESEEIDIWISNHSNDRPFSDEADVILAECKNWTGKCGKNDFVQFYHKIANRGGRCTVGFLISWNGFAETITTEMLRASREAPLIVPIDGDIIRRAVESGDFLKILVEARQQALMI